MNTFNWVVLLWQVSFVLSVITFLYGLFKKSWISMLICLVTFLPVAYFFNGANNVWRLVTLIPIILLLLSFVLWKKPNLKK
jgi:hypothetical protein